ncbi:MAG: CD1871A family CXXC motif-containing protein [Slackia sp.]
MPVWAVVFIAAIVLIVLGVAQGEVLDVWRKASLICYECIGIG